MFRRSGTDQCKHFFFVVVCFFFFSLFAMNRIFFVFCGGLPVSHYEIVGIHEKWVLQFSSAKMAVASKLCFCKKKRKKKKKRKYTEQRIDYNNFTF